MLFILWQLAQKLVNYFLITFTLAVGKKGLSNSSLHQLFLSCGCGIGLHVANNQKKLNRVTYVRNIGDC